MPKNLAIIDSLDVSKSDNDITKISNSNHHNNNKNKSSKLCGIHYKNIEVYCELDKSMLCVNCILESSHKNHTLTEINKVSSNIQINKLKRLL